MVLEIEDDNVTDSKEQNKLFSWSGTWYWNLDRDWVLHSEQDLERCYFIFSIFRYTKCVCVCLCVHAVSTEGLCLVSFGFKIEGVDRGCCCEWDTYALGGKNEKIEEKKSQTTHCL